MEKLLKKTFKLRIILSIIFFSYPVFLIADDLEIVVDISEQRLFIIDNDLVKESFPV